MFDTYICTPNGVKAYEACNNYWKYNLNLVQLMDTVVIVHLCLHSSCTFFHDPAWFPSLGLWESCCPRHPPSQYHYWLLISPWISLSSWNKCPQCTNLFTWFILILFWQILFCTNSSHCPNTITFVFPTFTQTLFG